MKSRLPMAPLTEEDFLIRLRLKITYFGMDDADLLCGIDDQRILDARRDADLMLHVATGGCRFCGNARHLGYGEIIHRSDCVYVESWPQ